jgi:DsbC/DsbD-like thiol-disulfide interchange protein
MSTTRFLRPLALLALLTLAATPQALAQGKKSDSVVKVTAKTDKPAADGKQVVTVTLAVDKGWHVYANPVGLEDLAPVQTTITIEGKAKPESVKVDYPPGKLVKDAVVGNYKVYKDKTSIKVTVVRAKGDSGPLEVKVKVQSCNEKTCLLPATITVKVP